MSLWDGLYCRGESGVGDRVTEGQRELLLGFAVAVVGTDDALDEVVADDVDVFEVAEADAFYSVEDVEGFEEAGFLGVGQVGLGEVAGDDSLGVGAEAGDEHLHLLHGGVLGLVHDDEGVGEGAAAHEGERGYFNDVGLEHLVDLDWVEEIVESVVEGAEIGVDFFLKAAREEAETFAGLDGRADEDDAADFFRHVGADGHGDGEVGFAGAGGTEAEGHVALFDGLDVLALVGRAGLDHALDAGGALLACVDERFEGDGGVGDDEFEHAVEFAVVEVDAGFSEGVEVGEDLFDAGDAVGFAGDVDGVASEIDGYVQLVLEEAKIFIVGPVEGFYARSDFEGFFYQVVS